MQTYWIRYNIRHKGYILVSCCYGHSVTMIYADRTFGGSAEAAKMSSNGHSCSDCENIGIRKAA